MVSWIYELNESEAKILLKIKIENKSNIHISDTDVQFGDNISNLMWA